jgi:hypothetical protein
MSFRSICWRSVACLTLAFAPCTAAETLAPQDSPTAADATLKLSGGIMAVGVGYKWGRGTLTYQGQQLEFCVRGLSVGDAGAVKMDAQGSVYNLKSVGDFAGRYFAISGGFTVARGESTSLLKNKSGVMIQLETLETGLRFDIAAGGTRFIMAGQRGCKK